MSENSDLTMVGGEVVEEQAHANQDQTNGQAPEQSEQQQEQDQAPEKPQKTEAERTQEAINKAIGKQYARFKDSEAQRIELEAKLAALEAKLGVSGDTPIPEMPDQFDPDFVEKMQARERAIHDNAKKAYEKELRDRQSMENIRLENERRITHTNKAAATFEANSAKLGVGNADLYQANMLVSSVGMDKDVALHILEDDHGPLILKYLGDNPSALDTINSLSPAKAGAYIEKTIVGAIKQARDKIPNQKYKPTGTLKADGAPSSERALKGATFE